MANDQSFHPHASLFPILSPAFLLLLASSIWGCAAISTVPGGSEAPPGAVPLTGDMSTSPYLVIDISTGPSSSHYPAMPLDSVPPGGWTYEYKTTRLVLRRIESGSFTMGERSTDCHGALDGGRLKDKLHEVVLTKPFYIGVFEVTQKQWQLVMGRNPSYFKGDLRPVERVSYQDIRGAATGTGWPESSAVDMDSFLGRLRIRAGTGAFDLPTEAQWEYACRAGTSTALNSGKNLVDSWNPDPCMAEVGRYIDNNADGYGGYAEHTVVGSYCPNAWGLYDMHGNVWELCLDQNGHLSSTDVDPVGPNHHSWPYRIQRGGGWNSYADYCRSGYRCHVSQKTKSDETGFRLCFTPDYGREIPSQPLSIHSGR